MEETFLRTVQTTRDRSQNIIESGFQGYTYRFRNDYIQIHIDPQRDSYELILEKNLNLFSKVSFSAPVSAKIVAETDREISPLRKRTEFPPKTCQVESIIFVEN